MERMRIWYHATTGENAASIRATGFREGTHFAQDLADAVEFGSHVLEVALPERWWSEAGWQLTIQEPLGPSAIVRHYAFEKTVLFEKDPASLGELGDPINYQMHAEDLAKEAWNGGCCTSGHAAQLMGRKATEARHKHDCAVRRYLHDTRRQAPTESD